MRPSLVMTSLTLRRLLSSKRRSRLGRMPIPPSRARAMARLASVTVSIAADSMGMFRVISLVSLLRMSTSRGKTCEKAGNNNTSSNVSPSPKNFEGDFDLPVGVFILAMCKDNAAGKCGPNFCEEGGAGRSRVGDDSRARGILEGGGGAKVWWPQGILGRGMGGYFCGG